MEERARKKRKAASPLGPWAISETSSSCGGDQHRYHLDHYYNNHHFDHDDDDNVVIGTTGNLMFDLVKHDDRIHHFSDLQTCLVQWCEV